VFSERYQRCTTRLTCQVRPVMRELAGQTGTLPLERLSVRLSRNTAVRVLLRIPLPQRPIPAGAARSVDREQGRSADAVAHVLCFLGGSY
jgi:hypothetical protein